MSDLEQEISRLREELRRQEDVAGELHAHLAALLAGIGAAERTHRQSAREARRAAVTEVAAIMAKHSVPDTSDQRTLMIAHARVWADLFAWVFTENFAPDPTPSPAPANLPQGRTISVPTVEEVVADMRNMRPAPFLAEPETFTPTGLAPRLSTVLPCIGCTPTMTPELTAACERCGGDGLEPCAACGKPADVWVPRAFQTGVPVASIALCAACEKETRGGG